MRDRYVVVVGNMFGGKTIHGPFEDSVSFWAKEKAEQWAEEHAQGQHFEVVKLEYVT